MILLFAQPYDLSAEGFYFTSEAEYERKSAKNLNALGFPVEEYEIHFIDGEMIDAELFEAAGINQSSFGKFLDACENWDELQKQKVVVAVGECGYGCELTLDAPDDLDVDIYEMNDLRELACYFVEEGLLGEIPDRLKYYLDYDAIARDLGMDYSETTIAGKRLVYRCF